jgi:hypothetical protein
MSQEQTSMNPLGVMYGFKAIRLVLTYLSLTLTTNFMSQIYMEKVLVNNEEPPSLMNYLWLFLMIDVFLNIMLLIIIVLLDKLKMLGSGSSILGKYIADYCIGSSIIIVLTYIVASTMYAKKYFMYKEDGLRAIRALSDIMMRFALIAHLLPIEHAISKLMAASKMSVDELVEASKIIKQVSPAITNNTSSKPSK